MIYPNDMCKVWFDVMISLILCISCFTVPLDLAFQHMFAGDMMWFNYAIDVFFFMDIVVNFFSATQDDEYQIIDDRKIVVKQYMKGWFLIDIVAIIPLDLLIPQQENGNELS
jgi:hypothetical protein